MERGRDSFTVVELAKETSPWALEPGVLALAGTVTELIAALTEFKTVDFLTRHLVDTTSLGSMSGWTSLRTAVTSFFTSAPAGTVRPPLTRSVETSPQTEEDQTIVEETFAKLAVNSVFFCSNFQIISCSRESAFSGEILAPVVFKRCLIIASSLLTSFKPTLVSSNPALVASSLVTSAGTLKLAIRYDKESSHSYNPFCKELNRSSCEDLKHDISLMILFNKSSDIPGVPCCVDAGIKSLRVRVREVVSDCKRRRVL